MFQTVSFHIPDSSVWIVRFPQILPSTRYYHFFTWVIWSVCEISLWFRSVPLEWPMMWTASCAYLLSAYLLWWNIYWCLCPFSNWIVCILNSWVLRILYTLWIAVFTMYRFCKYFPPVCSFSSYAFHRGSHRTQVSNFIMFGLLIFPFRDCVLGAESKNALPFTQF